VDNALLTLDVRGAPKAQLCRPRSLSFPVLLHKHHIHPLLLHTPYSMQPQSGTHATSDTNTDIGSFPFPASVRSPHMTPVILPSASAHLSHRRLKLASFQEDLARPIAGLEQNFGIPNLRNNWLPCRSTPISKHALSEATTVHVPILPRPHCPKVPLLERVNGRRAWMPSVTADRFRTGLYNRRLMMTLS